MKKAPFPEWKRAFCPENQGGVRSLKTMADFFLWLLTRMAPTETEKPCLSLCSEEGLPS